MKAPAALVLAALHLAAASLPCPPAAAGREAREAHASGAVHATHSRGAAEAEEATRELRAPCPCGCRHASSEVPAVRLGPALLRLSPVLARPGGTLPLAASEPVFTALGPGAREPVPRAA